MASRKGILNGLFICILIGISILVLCRNGSINEAFSMIWLWPVLYTIFYCVYSCIEVKPEHKLVLTVIIYYQFLLKYVAYPLFLSFTDSSFIGSTHISLTTENIKQAVNLGIYEIIVAFLFIFILEKFRFSHNAYVEYESGTNYFRMAGSKQIYFIYICFCLLLYLVYGRQYQILTFLTVSDNPTPDTRMLILIKYFIIIALCFAVLWGISHCKRKYDEEHLTRYIIYALLYALLLICMIQSGSRSGQVYIILLMILILRDAFPTVKNKLTGVLCVVGLVAFFIISTFREGDISWFSSLENLVKQIQIYYGGATSIAEGIKTFEGMSINVGNALFDLIRPIFPISQFFDESQYLLSQLYNYTLYHGSYITGQLLFSTSYGYITMGTIGMPIIVCTNIFVAAYFNKKFYCAKSLETKYLFGFCALRCAMTVNQNLPSILGWITQYLVIFGLVIGFSKMFYGNQDDLPSDTNSIQGGSGYDEENIV